MSMSQFLLVATLYIGAPAQTDSALGWLADNESYLIEVADHLWEIPEAGHQEVETSQYLQGELESAGFDVEVGVAGLPTAFVATYGSGRPNIGIVALMDALPGLSQEKFATERRPITPGHAGHGCGHNLIGAADLGAALAVKHAIETEQSARHGSFLRRTRGGDLSRRRVHGS